MIEIRNWSLIVIVFFKILNQNSKDLRFEDTMTNDSNDQ